MKRWLAREALLGFAALFATLGTGCKPDNSVKPGAPVLTELIIAQPGVASRVLPTTTDCGATVMDAMACDPTTDMFCRQASAKNWCNCAGTDPMDPAVGAWGCAPFANVAGVIAIFDRVIDTAPFDPATGAADSAASVSVPAGSPAATLAVDYAANGSTTGLIFPLLGNYVVGNFRVNGPSLLMSGTPEFPSNTAITLSLNRANVRAKDGKTGFSGDGLLQDGTIEFTTAAFAASITPPPEMEVDGGTAPAAPDMTPATISFTNFVDAMAITSHITVTSGGTAIPFTVAGDGANFTITPDANWPANATITITVDATTPDLLAETLGAAVTASFMTGAP